MLLTIVGQTLAVSPASAATVELSGMHMAAKPGAARSSVKRFPAGTKAVYFDYAVRAPYDGDDGLVAVYRGGTSGKRLAQAPLVFSVQGSLYVRLRLNGKSWPRGGYCSVIYVDGEVATGARSLIAWSVGGASLPSCPRP
jgi:hypothetical protein